MVGMPSTENKEALTVPDDTKDIDINRVNERVLLEENSTVGVRNTYGTSFILGSASNAVLGTNALGAASRVETTLWIVSPNNIFREHFRDTFFEAGATTAGWGDTSGQLDFTNTEIAVSNSIALNDGTVLKGTVSVVLSTGSLSDLSFELSADGGSTFESVTHNVEHTFTVTGTDLRFRITASGTVKVVLVKVIYIV